MVVTMIEKRYRQSRLKQATMLIVLLVIGLFMVTSCGKEEPQTTTADYTGWTKYSYGHFIIQLAPNSRFLADKAELARAYERFLTEICEMLEMPVPEGKIYLYVYGGRGDAKEMTGIDAPYSNDSAIHWEGFYPYGYQLTKFLLAKRGLANGRHKVLNEGIAYLLDFSGINYHDRVNRMYNSGQFVGLLKLGDNESFDSLKVSARRNESASLAGFILFGYGIDRFFMLNASLATWKESIETLFQMDADVFEKSWLAFVREYSDDPAGTMENDTTQIIRIEVDGQ